MLSKKLKPCNDSRKRHAVWWDLPPSSHVIEVMLSFRICSPASSGFSWHKGKRIHCERPFAFPSSMHGDPGAVSRVGRKGATKVSKHRRKSPWVPTLTGPFPDGQANTGSWLGTKMLCIIVPNRRTEVLPSHFREFVHDGYYLATVARFIHQVFLTRNEGTTNKSKNVSDAISRSNSICTETDHNVS